MRRTSFFTAAFAGSMLAAASAFGGGADKVTGEFTQGSCFDCQPGDELGSVAYRLVSAHEAFGRRPQKGFFLSWRDDGLWFEMDFRDTVNTCVHVDAEEARIGGLVSDGNGDQVGRYFGLQMVDGGEPAYFVDYGYTYRVSLDKWSEAARLALHHWCNTGEFTALNGSTVWPSVVIAGNLQVHNSSADGD